MKLGSKILSAAAIAVLLSTIGAIITVYNLSSRNRIVELREKMSSVIEQSESVASSMDYMYKHDAFDQAGLLKKATEQAAGRPLSEIYSSTALYTTIPIVAAWRSVEAAAKKNGFEFFTPSKPGVPARNPKNNNGTQFIDAFNAFERGETEYFFHDKETKQLVLARPVHLTASCLSCHGDPVKSSSGNGKDILGLPMENLKVGDVKGAFILKATISHDPVVLATVRSMIFVGGGILLAVLAGFHAFSSRGIIMPLTSAINQIHGASEQTSAASAQVASASQALAEGSSEQAASLEETSASLEEITSMVRRSADSAQEAKRITTETHLAAESGVQSNLRLNASLESIRTASSEMRAAVEGIKVSSGNVAKIIKTIDEIAFQTNILALNAAVEAARAGDAGQGFAVVADEVRNLAHRSATAAKETAALIEAAMRQSEHGVTVNEKVVASVNAVAVTAADVAKCLGEIVSRVSEVDAQVSQIASATREQAEGIQQINTAVTQLDKATQSNAASAEESASASHMLDEQSRALRTTVTTLRSIVIGSSKENSFAGTDSTSHASQHDQGQVSPINRIKNTSTDRAHQNLTTENGGTNKSF